VERREELGVCAALGLRPGQLAGLVVYESLVLTTVSLAPGLFLGLGVHHYFATSGLDLRWLSTSNFPKSWIVFDPVIHSRLDLGQIVWFAGVVLTMVAGLSLYPALKAARARLSEARRGV
jgi:ABC-type antimicrobial peptide transport system permease subunit